MKPIKIFIPIFIILMALCVCLLIFSPWKVKMYSTDGKTMKVSSSDVKSREEIGWYTSPPVVLYNLDGNTITVASQDAKAQEKDGWYTYPVTELYGSDGRSIVVETSTVSEWNSAGWYIAPAKDQTTLLDMLKGTWIYDDKSTYSAGIPFIDFSETKIQTGWSCEFYTSETINNITIVDNNTYRIDSTVQYLDFSYPTQNESMYIYYDGGKTLKINNDEKTWKYVGTIEDVINLSQAIYE